MRDGGHEVSILMRLGDGDCAGRTPSNVSTMIMRPPQQGQRRAGETSSASPSTSSGGRSGASALDVAGSDRAGEEAVVADAVKAAGQHMQQEATHELIRAQAHGFVARGALDSVVLPTKGDTSFIHSHEA
jgi:hypothetical protein